MATIPERIISQGGISLSFRGGEVKVMADIPKLTAAKEFDKVGKVAVVVLDQETVDQIVAAVRAEGGRFWRRILRALGIK